MRSQIIAIFLVSTFIILASTQLVSAATSSITMNPNTEVFFQDNGQIRSADDNHRILFRRTENILELREYGDILLRPGSTSSSQASVTASNYYNNDVGAYQIATFKKDDGRALSILGRPGAFLFNTNDRYIFYTDNGKKDLEINDKGIITKQVTVQSDWADYVFDNNYNLMNLSDLDTYISQNKHLPDIPDVSSIENDGLKLGEMQKLQMEKIEELTLYIIQMNKRVDALEKENGELRALLN